MLSLISNLFRPSRSRDGMYEVTPRKLLKTLRGDLEQANRKDIAPVPEEIYMTVLKMFPNTTPDIRMQLAEKIDNIFLNLPNK